MRNLLVFCMIAMFAIPVLGQYDTVNPCWVIRDAETEECLTGSEATVLYQIKSHIHVWPEIPASWCSYLNKYKGHVLGCDYPYIFQVKFRVSAQGNENWGYRNYSQDWTDVPCMEGDNFCT